MIKEKELQWGGYIGTNTRCFVCGRTEDEINQIVRDNFKIRENLERDDIEVIADDPLCHLALPLEVSGIGTVFFRIALCQVCENLFPYLAHHKIGQWLTVLSMESKYNEEEKELMLKYPVIEEIIKLFERTEKRVNDLSDVKL